ncbi:hypothetical protein [Peribacillus sp. SCS-155]|uniref:hypothetical protein n=1 Tax=Peribacillus sedimenti TaxID=3115297 RepID=UPI0039060F44
MFEDGYFSNENYTGDHLHINNWTDDLTPYLEAVAWERQDRSMDIFFDDLEDHEEFIALFGAKEHYYDEFKGVFLGNAKTDDDAYEVFRKWVANVLYPYRDRKDNR